MTPDRQYTAFSAMRMEKNNAAIKKHCSLGQIAVDFIECKIIFSLGVFTIDKIDRGWDPLARGTICIRNCFQGR